MRLLAVEASGNEASCALWLDGEVLERACPTPQTSSETLLPEIARLMTDAGIAWSSLDGIAFGCGPGSFTGLRVAVGVTQGLAFAADVPVVPVETLAALAWDAQAPLCLSMLDARMGEVYAGVYERSGSTVIRCGALTVGAPERVNLDDLAARELAMGVQAVVCGNAYAAYPALSERLFPRFVLAAQLPRARAVAALGAACFADSALAAESAQPLYVRDKVAQTTAERLAQGGRA